MSWYLAIDRWPICDNKQFNWIEYPGRDLMERTCTSQWRERNCVPLCVSAFSVLGSIQFVLQCWWTLLTDVWLVRNSICETQRCLLTSYDCIVFWSHSIHAEELYGHQPNAPTLHQFEATVAGVLPEMFFSRFRNSVFILGSDLWECENTFLWSFGWNYFFKNNVGGGGMHV